MADFPALGHVAVTVSDLDRSRQWYQALFGGPPVVDEDTGPFHHAVWALGSTLFGIHKHSTSAGDDAMNELKPGLDHIAFNCANRDELVAWQQRLDELGVKHGGVVDASYGSGLSFRDPDNIPLEFFCFPG